MQEKSNTSDAFSDRIEHLRKALGGSMVAVAAALGVSRTMLYDIRNGKVPVSDKMWRLLETAERGKPPDAPPPADTGSDPRLKAAAALMRRQALALLRGADEIDPDLEASDDSLAREALDNLSARAATGATGSDLEVRKRA